MKLIGTGLALFGLAAAHPEWQNFKKTFNKVYRNPVEESRRLNIFTKNMDFVFNHNARFAAGEETYTVAMNQFTDLTNQEFNTQYLMPYQSVEAGIRLNYQCPESFTASGAALPDSVDWRSTSNPQSTVAVTAVKDQGSCGSCWSFATTGTFEGQLCLAGSEDCSSWSGASEQQLVDCGGKDNTDLGNYYDMACNGGWIDNGLYYIQQTGYSDSESSYPYVSGTTKKAGTCVATSANSVGSLTTCGATVKNSESDLQGAIAEVGPVGIAIDAGGIGFQMYSGGVYTSNTCSSTHLNHAVLAVGYGNLDGSDYWTVKNSWGTAWGDQGYILMARNNNNMCGTAATPAYPIL